MTDRIKAIFFKEFDLSSKNLVDLLSKLSVIAWRLNIDFQVKDYDWENTVSSEKTPEEVIVNIDCWSLIFVQEKEVKKYFLREIKVDQNFKEVKWFQITILNTLFLRSEGKILWAVIGKAAQNYKFRVEKKKIHLKKLTAKEQLSTTINWNEEFEEIESVNLDEQFYYKEDEQVFY